MANRVDLQNKLVELFESTNVYYQPPESIKMEYPAIIYFKSRIETTKANDSTYSKNNLYEIIVVDRKPDNPVIDKLLSLPYCTYDRNYKSDNLNHDVLNLYF